MNTNTASIRNPRSNEDQRLEKSRWKGGHMLESWRENNSKDLSEK